MPLHRPIPNLALSSPPFAARCIHEATKRMPIIGDGDTGYGNALNIKRTVRGYAAAGFAGILIEDQVAPKSCGHVKGKKVVTREEAVSRIRAAVDARNEGADILIVARTDARQAISLEVRQPGQIGWCDFVEGHYVR